MSSEIKFRGKYNAYVKWNTIRPGTFLLPWINFNPQHG